MRFRTHILGLLALGLVALLPSQIAVGEQVNFMLWWKFDNPAYDPAGEYIGIYTPGSVIVLSASIENTCDMTFRVRQVRVYAEWMSEGEYATLTPLQEVKLIPGEEKEIGKVRIDVPPDLSPGVYHYYFEVDVETLSGGEWTPETYVVEGTELVISEMIAMLDVDYSTEEGYAFRLGGEAKFRVHIANEGGATTHVEYVRIYTGWPTDKFSENEFYECLEPGQEFSLGPGDEVDLECAIPLPSDLPPGRYYSRIEVKTVTNLMGVKYTEYWTSDYQMDYEIQEAESFIEKYKEVLGIVTATASAASVVIGVYKKWKSSKSG